MEYREPGHDEFRDLASRILYEDNHVLVFNKRPGEIVQGDKMERELIKIVEESDDEHYRIRNGGSYVTYDSKRNLHINTRIIELVIV